MAKYTENLAELHWHSTTPNAPFESALDVNSERSLIGAQSENNRNWPIRKHATAYFGRRGRFLGGSLVSMGVEQVLRGERSLYSGDPDFIAAAMFWHCSHGIDHFCRHDRHECDSPPALMIEDGSDP